LKCREEPDVDFDFNEDQTAIGAAVTQIVGRHADATGLEADYFQRSPDFEAALKASEFLDVGRLDGASPLDALVVIEAVARSRFVVELCGTAFVLPMLGLPAQAQPVALLDGVHPGPARFLAAGGTVLADVGDEVRLVSTGASDVAPVASPYGYPMGRWTGGPLKSAGERLDVSPVRFRRLWRQALCTEAIGCMQTALDLVVQYVKDRKQFGRPLGAFQVIQHRLSECAVLVAGARVLLQEAATVDSEDSSAFAAAYVQEAAARLIYETHQFHGAIGLTLEYPLHYWTYRLRVLQGELGGVANQALTASHAAWPGERPISESFKGQVWQD
jgi:hypothetical protein